MIDSTRGAVYATSPARPTFGDALSVLDLIGETLDRSLGSVPMRHPFGTMGLAGGIRLRRRFHGVSQSLRPLGVETALNNEPWVRCLHCGRSTPASGMSCVCCGNPLPQPGWLFCLRCGSWNPPDAATCGQCRGVLDASHREEWSLRSNDPDPDQRVPADGQSCPQCGAVTKPSRRFCLTCGTRLTPSPGGPS